MQDKRGLSDNDWNSLLLRIGKKGKCKCTPFLGAGINNGILSLGDELAGKLREEFECPLDCMNLAEIAQYVALESDPLIAKESVVAILNDELDDQEEDIAKMLVDQENPLSILADIPFPIYITTNYDDLMVKALEARSTREPKRDFCRWSEGFEIGGEPSILDPEFGFTPNAANPLVFHLHGYDKLEESLVLTEDDYLDFLVKISQDRDKALPLCIQKAITGTSLLFVGYALKDWDFRVLFRGLVSPMARGMRRRSIAVQLDREEDEKDYMIKYFEAMDISVYWGTAKEFMVELKERWENYSKK